jgi:hypothetical protein
MNDRQSVVGSRTRALIDPDDSVLVLLDHQAGLFQTVKDISIAELRANTTMLARFAAPEKSQLATA